MRSKLKPLIALLLTVVVCFVLVYKPPVESASMVELDRIPGIGRTLAMEIKFHCLHNDEVDVEDLIVIDGIGPIRLEAIKERYR